MPNSSGPSLFTICFNFSLTIDRAVSQSDSFHWPFSLIIGTCKRSSLFKPSYEKRSLSEIQHSLIDSSSRGSILITLFCLICASSGEPKLSWCAKVGLLISSHVRALYLNGLLVRAPTGHKSMIFPESSD